MMTLSSESSTPTATTTTSDYVQFTPILKIKSQPVWLPEPSNKGGFNIKLVQGHHLKHAPQLNLKRSDCEAAADRISRSASFGSTDEIKHQNSIESLETIFFHFIHSLPEGIGAVAMYRLYNAIRPIKLTDEFLVQQAKLLVCQAGLDQNLLLVDDFSKRILINMGGDQGMTILTDAIRYVESCIDVQEASLQEASLQDEASDLPNGKMLARQILELLIFHLQSGDRNEKVEVPFVGTTNAAPFLRNANLKDKQVWFNDHRPFWITFLESLLCAADVNGDAPRFLANKDEEELAYYWLFAVVATFGKAAVLPRVYRLLETRTNQYQDAFVPQSGTKLLLQFVLNQALVRDCLAFATGGKSVGAWFKDIAEDFILAPSTFWNQQHVPALGQFSPIIYSGIKAPLVTEEKKEDEILDQADLLAPPCLVRSTKEKVESGNAPRKIGKFRVARKTEVEQLLENWSNPQPRRRNKRRERPRGQVKLDKTLTELDEPVARRTRAKMDR